MVLPPRTVRPVLDELCLRAAVRVGSPVALVSILEEDGQSLPGAYGLAEPWRSERWTPLSHSFCRHVVSSREPFVVANAHDDPLVARSPAVLELGVIAYAGVPLVLGGSVVGAFCAIDHRPRQWTGEEIDRLRLLSVEAGQLLGG